jgi:FAD/FMN-containing dehydrogenase
MTIIASQSSPVKPRQQAKQPVAKPLAYRVEASEPHLTGFGGAGLLAMFLERLGVPQLLAALPNLPRTRYPGARFLLGLLHGLVLDRSRQAHVSELGDDAVFLRLTGLESLPSQSAFSRFLARLRVATAHGLLETNRALVAKVRHGFTDHDTVTLDFDRHVQSCRGRPQRSAVDYNPRRRGAPSYKPLFCFVGETRDFVGGRFHPGNRADLAGAKALFDQLRRWLKRVGFAGRLQFRADNGFYAGWLLEHLERAKVTYAIVADLGGLALTLVGLKYRPLDTEYAVAEFWHRGAGWKRARRMIAIRRRVDPKEPKRGKQVNYPQASLGASPQPNKFG